MTRFLVVGILTVAFNLGATFGAAPQEQRHGAKETGESESKRVDVHLDKASATKIAEIILVNVYGEEVLDQRPWRVSKKDGVFKIEGTLPKDSLGGVAEIEIKGANAEVVRIVHEL